VVGHPAHRLDLDLALGERERDALVGGQRGAERGAAAGVGHGLALTTGKRTDTAATNGTGVDFGDPSPAAFSYGLQAYLHVFAFTGTNATIKLQQSSDNGAGDAWSDVVGGAFASVTSGPQAQRIETARDLAVERYLRVVTTGTFTSLQFAVATTVNTSEMTI
jgi:hypothetical protein